MQESRFLVIIQTSLTAFPLVYPLKHHDTPLDRPPESPWYLRGDDMNGLHFSGRAAAQQINQGQIDRGMLPL